MATKRKKKVKVRRLYKMEPIEDAFVSYGANDRVFAVVKEKSMAFNVDVFTKASEELASIISVLKAGTPDDGASKTLTEKVNFILGNLAKECGFQLTDSPVEATPGIKAGIEALAKTLKGYGVDVQSKDLTMADKLDAAADTALALLTQKDEEETQNDDDGDDDSKAQKTDAEMAKEKEEAEAKAKQEAEAAKAADDKKADAEAAKAAEDKKAEEEKAAKEAEAAKAAGKEDPKTETVGPDMMAEMKKMLDGFTKGIDEKIQTIDDTADAEWNITVTVPSSGLEIYCLVEAETGGSDQARLELNA